MPYSQHPRAVRSRIWREANPEKKSISGKKYRARIKAATVAFMGGCCVRCGFADPRALQIDHVHGGGSKERRWQNNPLTVHKEITKPENAGKYQLLCANCNWIKRAENNENAKGRRPKVL